MRIAELTVRPTERRLDGPSGTTTLEPLVMTLFSELLDCPGALVTRRLLFERLWGSLVVGDDSLNRLVAVLRRALRDVGATSVQVETVPGSGYVLRLVHQAGAADATQDVQQAVDEAFDSWRLGLPRPDRLRIALLRRAAVIAPNEQRVFGLLALLHRHAAEYGSPDAVSDHVGLCEAAARRALDLDPSQAEAQTALASIAPIYGRWLPMSQRLVEICAESNGHAVPENDLSVLEMATGQVAASKKRRDRLIERDPLAAAFCFKSVYQHWSVGDHAKMDHVADRALQLWPFHPAVWTARFWSLAYTNRIPAAEAMLSRPSQGLPRQMLAFFARVLVARSAGTVRLVDDAAAEAVALAGEGPAHAIAALFALGLLRRTDQAFAVADRYYFHQGFRPVPLQPGPDHPQLNEQHRRVTQILFTPACAGMREDPRFPDLCRAIGLTSFWEQSGTTPDYQL